MRVAIDGPAGSGKSTVAHALAERCGLMLLDTGAMYRSVTLACLTRGIDVSDADAVAAVAEAVRITFGTDEAGDQTVFLDGVEVTRDIRTAQVDANVSAVAAIPAVREAMVAEQRRLGAAGDVVAEGRDIGTVVFPDAEVKVFLTADPAARAHRRAVQRAGGNAATDPSAAADAQDEQAILDDLKRRDEADSSRAVAPLRPAEDAVHIDSSSLTVEEEVAQIAALIDKARAQIEPVPQVENNASDVKVEVKENTQQNIDGLFNSPKETDKELKAEVKTDVDADVKPDAEFVSKADVKENAQAKAQSNVIENSQTDSAPNVKADAKGEAKTDARPQKKAAKKEKKDKKEQKSGPLRVFGHNQIEDYYDHPMREHPITSRALMGVTIWVTGALSKLLWPWKLENGEKLWNAEGGRMLVMNHASAIDPVLLAITDWAHGRRMRPIYKSEFDKHPFITWYFSRVGAIPVKRGTADLKAVRRAQRALQNGEDVLVFPEGTRIHSDDQEITLHAGFAVMAQLAKVPVLPIAIVGSRDGAPGGNKPLRPGRIWMRVGDQISFDELGVKGRKQQAKAMEERAMKQVYELRDGLRADHPGKM